MAKMFCSLTHKQKYFISAIRIRMIFILLPALRVWFVYAADFWLLKAALKQTYCVLPSLLNLAQGMESVLGKIISCRNNEAIGTLLPFFFPPLLEGIWIYPVV